MKKLLLNASVALAGFLAGPTAADAQHFTPEQLKEAAERSDKVNDQIKAQEEGGAGGTDIQDIAEVIGLALLSVAGAYGTSKVLYGGLKKLLDKPGDSSQPGNGSTPTQEGPTQEVPTPTADQPTSPPEATDPIVTGLDLELSSLNPGHLLTSTNFRDQAGVEQDGIGWGLSSDVVEFTTRAGKKAYRIELTPSENDHFDQLVISIFQSETSGNDNTYSVKAAFQKTNLDGTISAPYVVSLSKLDPSAKLYRNKLCDMVESAMERIHNCAKDEAPVSPDLLERVGDYVLAQDLVTTDSIIRQFPGEIPNQQVAGTVLALLRAEGVIGAVNDNGESEVIMPNPPTS